MFGKGGSVSLTRDEVWPEDCFGVCFHSPHSPGASLQKVGGHLARGNDSVSVGNCVEHFWFPVVAVLKLQNGGYITAPVAVVGSRPYSNQGVVEHVLVSFVNQLMCTTYQLEVVDRHEFFGNLRSEKPPSSPWTDGPTVNFFWIAPNKITEGSFVRNFLIPLDKSNLIQCSNIWGQSPVDTKNRLVNECGDREEVEYPAAVSPRVTVSVLVLALVVEAVNLRDLTRFVISAEECDLVWPLRLENEEASEGLQAVVASVNEVAHENVVSVR